MRTNTVSIAALAAAAIILTNCTSTESAKDAGEPETITVTGGVSAGEDGSASEPAPAPPSPPPPPPPPAVERAEADLAYEAAPSDASSLPDPSMPAPVPMPEPDPVDEIPPQSGLLTAGDYDDLLNAQLYRDYASEFLQNQRGNLDLPDIDVTDAITIKVLDRNAQPLRGATVALTAGGSGHVQPENLFMQARFACSRNSTPYRRI